MTATELSADLTRRANIIADAIITAFGGRSQVSTTDIGRAVAGQICNNGLSAHGTVEVVCVAVMDALDAISGDAADDVIGEVVGGCRAALDSLGVRYSDMPHPVAISAPHTIITVRNTDTGQEAEHAIYNQPIMTAAELEGYARDWVTRTEYAPWVFVSVRQI